MFLGGDGSFVVDRLVLSVPRRCWIVVCRQTGTQCSKEVMDRCLWTDWYSGFQGGDGSLFVDRLVLSVPRR